MQPHGAVMWKSQCSGMLWPFVLPSTTFFFFFPKITAQRVCLHAYVHFIFKRRGKKRHGSVPLHLQERCSLDNWDKLQPFFFFLSVLINIMGHFGSFSCKCTSLYQDDAFVGESGKRKD